MAAPLDALWEKLPKFMRHNKTVRAEITDDSADIPPYAGEIPWVEKPIDQANLITSQSLGIGDNAWHYPVLDLDFPAELIPSSTPGHFHLFVNRLVHHDKYMKLLDALVEANIIQPGYRDAAKQRGATSVRLPWIKKGDKAANSLDPEAEKKKLDSAIEFHESILIELKQKKEAMENPWITIGSLSEDQLNTGLFTINTSSNDTFVTITPPVDKDLEW